MCYENYFFCPKQFEYMTKKVMVLFLKYGGRFSFVLFFHSDRTKEGSFCVLSRTTKGLVIMIVIITRHGSDRLQRGWHIFPRVKTFGNSMVPPWQKGSCMWYYLTRKAQPIPSAAVRLSAVVFFTKLGGYSLLTRSVLNS